MSITLHNLDLPADLFWTNEFDWNAQRQNLRRSVTGALLVQESAVTAGRPITLVGGDDFGWMSRDQVDAWYAQANAAPVDMALNFHGRNFTVRFTGDRFRARALQPFSEPASSDRYVPSLFLITVTP